MTTAPMVDYKIHWLKMMSVPESRAVVGRHDGIIGTDSYNRRATASSPVVAFGLTTEFWRGGMSSLADRAHVCAVVTGG